MNLRHIAIYSILVVFMLQSATAQGRFTAKEERFVDAKMEKMSIIEKVGQLIMASCDSEINKAKTEQVFRLIDSCKIGGVCFFKGSQSAVWNLRKAFSARSSLPLFYAIDGEWGLGMRLDDGYAFPRALALGALQPKDTLLVYNMGLNIGKQCKTLGISINFAPSLDINLNPLNPIINSRSFGEDYQRVAMLSSQYVQGLQAAGVMAVGKHFPGHGDTETDSHLDLPIIPHSRNFIDSIDAYPFIFNIKRGIQGIMVAHLSVPALDSVNPSSLSGKVVRDYLVKDLKYNGLIFTDGLNMKGITKHYGSGQAAILALSAGIDVLLMPDNIFAARDSVLAAVNDGRLSLKQVNEKCRKVLLWKNRLGLFASEDKDTTSQPFVMSESLLTEAKSIDNALSYRLITLIQNNDTLLPLNTAAKPNICFLPCDDTKFDTLIAEMKRYYDVKVVDFRSLPDTSAILLLGVGGKIAASATTNYGVGEGTLAKLDSISKSYPNTTLLLFANPYVLRSIDSLCFRSILVAYQTNASLQRSVGRALFCKHDFAASLPVTASENFTLGMRYERKSTGYDYSIPLKAGLDTAKFRIIDSIANNGIVQKAYPGCQIAVYKDTTLVFYRNYGFLTYDSLRAVTDNTLYDVASLTKILATTLSIMKLVEDEEINLDDKLSKYLPYLKKTNKKNITIKEVMSHFARLKAWYPFYKEQMQAPDSLKANYNRQYVLETIANTDLIEKNKYLYSDLGFILLGDLVEKVTGQPLDEFVSENFYAKMGLTHTLFNPDGIIADSTIAPTENDTLWRKKLIAGQVHDQTSSLMGGVAGHAGLFSTAKEVAALCQVLLNGSYDGVEYLKMSTLKTFNHRYFAKKLNRRALGFDKPLIHDVSTHCSKYASQESFGHSGFTGTYFWIDPAENLIYVFLSNRVYPDSSNNRLSNMNIRTDINDLIYQSLKK
ncbi:MAG: serine hydrolase [Bacteroidales bacterium]|nr:serine hydrolase [Bacteroidales bacterium]